MTSWPPRRPGQPSGSSASSIESAFAKKGTHSAGVARQPNGRLGKEQAQGHAHDDVKGLITCPDRKSIEPIALLVGRGDVSGLQKFINSAPWQADDIQAELQVAFDDELAPSAAGTAVGVVGVID